ncbi:MAG: MFS transporter [Candidatus Pacebacteria bacterium]|nr:MFS transporter [Candidatus Paceibacterota bacterium]
MIDTTTSTGLRKWMPLVVLAFALLIIILDTTILNVSLRTIIIDLHTNIQGIQWVITAYSLMLAAFTITGGRLGDLFGRKRMFILGASIFALGSFITSISTSVGMMILGEAIIEGIGAALMIPATTSLLVSNYQGRDRQIGFGVWGGIAGAGAALGPVVGGFLTTYYSWRWAFRINLVVAALLVLGSFVIKEARDTKEKPQLDYLGVVLSSLAMFLIVFGVIESSSYGWLAAKQVFTIGSVSFGFLGSVSIVVPSIALGLLLLGTFALWQGRREKSGKTPLVSLALFKNSVFIRSAMIVAILSLGQAGVSFALPVFFQSVLGLSAVQTGVAMLPMSLTLLAVSFFTAYLSKFVTPKRIIQVALMVDAVAFWALSFGVGTGSGAWALVPGLLLFGLGMGLLMSQASNMTLSAVSVKQSGEASGVNSTLRQLGASLGSAIMGAVLLTTLSSNLATGVQTSSVIPANEKPGIIQTVQSETSSIEFGSGSGAATIGIPPSLGNEIASISKTATTNASRDTLLVGIIFAVLAFILSLRLPNRKSVVPEPAIATAGH